MQNYIVLEITQNDQGNIAVSPSAKELESSAYKKYYEILGHAAESSNPIHAAVMMSAEGFKIEQKCFKHAPAPEPEPNAEDLILDSQRVSQTKFKTRSDATACWHKRLTITAKAWTL